MNAINNTIEAQSCKSPAIPNDLGLWIGRRELLDLAYEAAQTAPWPACKADPRREIPIEALRTLLIYSFATGLYASADIALSVPHDPFLSYICSNNVPDSSDLKSLRRAEQPSLRLALAMVVREVWNRRCTQSGNYPAAGLEAPTWVFQSDAASRLSRAVQAESASLED